MEKDINKKDLEKEPREVSKNFGDLLYYLRKVKKSYSLNDLERITGISSSYIYRLEKGERKAPSFPIIKKLAEALEVDIRDLLETAGEIEVSENPSLESLIMGNNFTFNGVFVNDELKKLMLDYLNLGLNSQWNEQTKINELFSIGKIIDEIKNVEQKENINII